MGAIVRNPDIAAQREAMQKLRFLVGKWYGQARILRGPGEPLELVQTEEAQYKLEGLLMIIEGVGHSKADGTLVLQALGIVSYDDEAAMYRMRAFNDGRYLETDLKLTDDEKGLTWGFVLGDVRTSSILQIDQQGDWTELHDIAIGSQPPKRFMEVKVSPTE